MDKSEKFGDLNQRIQSCRRCSRLVEYREKIALEKVRRFSDQEYWGKPLTGFGDRNARLLIIGLAPAAHGGNRTGRMFTGDSSGDWLIKALYQFGYANQPNSESLHDGLVLKDVYITAVGRCAPPANKLLPTEIANCSEYLLEELELISSARVILSLGKVAFDSYLRMNHKSSGKVFKFIHGARHNLDNVTLVASYHPSRQNTQTGRLTWVMWTRVFEKVRVLLDNK